MVQDAQSAPLLCSLLRSRATCAALFVAAATHIFLNTAGLGGLPCPLRSALHLPCPGCGLGRASALLLRGEWREAMAMHAFAPMFLIAVSIGAVITALPGRGRTAGIAALEHFERQTKFTSLLLGGLLFYWLSRFALDLWRNLSLLER